MKTLIIVMLTCLLLIIGVGAVTIDDTIFKTSSTNVTLNVTVPIIVDSIQVNSTHITLTNYIRNYTFYNETIILYNATNTTVPLISLSNQDGYYFINGTVPEPIITPVGGGGGSTTQCAEGLLDFYGTCVNDTKMDSLLFEELPSQVCQGQNLVIGVKVIDSNAENKEVSKVEGIINGISQSFTLSDDTYYLRNFNNLDVGNYQIQIKATDRILDTDYELSQTKEFTVIQCSQLDLTYNSLKQDTNLITEIIKDKFTGFDIQEDIFEQPTNKLLTILLFIITLTVLTIVFYNKHNKGDKNE